MHKIFSLIIYGIFTPILLSVISTVGVAGSLDGDLLGLNESKPYANYSVSSVGHDTNNMSEESISDFIFKKDSHPYNLTYEDWTEKWWQWAYSIPMKENPSYDETGKYCSENQKAPVWFLTLSFGHPVTRICHIPENTALLAILLNSECSYVEYANLTNEFELKDCAREQQDHVVFPMASLNGIKIPDLENYRIQSDLFNFTLPANNILGLPAQTTHAVSDGNWLFLKPLPPGNYELILKGNIIDYSNNNIRSSFAFAGPVGWNYTTTYRLTVG